ncbi:FAD binding domain-containing protein [Peribacillus glennii]|uniref:Xanthine dehydrogenase n=1 Tax=Peribacillus glennii TaxID=2303991 RepID=A0A372LA64_9BACI|nr:FAD binding domain-containing protein [Peribacillus glennii]RFU62465.1 xanthine dehydrogenase [Peribacillus glennii]
MIPFNFQYSKPQTIQEAVRQFYEYNRENKKAFYFSGGTELITLGRLNLVYADAVIDLKGIHEYSSIFFYENYLVIGGGATLTAIEEANVFPLLGKTASEIADRTSRNKITIGGNICGQIFYREAILPLLISDCLLGISEAGGIVYQPIHKIFNKQIHLKEGEFIFSILIDKMYVTMPFVSIKRRKQWDVGYPLVTVAAIKKENLIRMAVSGVCPFPFRSLEMEKALNEKGLPVEERVETALRSMPGPVLSDVEGSAEYRLFVLKNTMIDAIGELEGERGV